MTRASLIVLAALPACYLSHEVGDDGGARDLGADAPALPDAAPDMGARDAGPDAGCSGGRHVCAGTCVDEGPASCGASCAVCSAPAHGSATCDSGVCGFACDAGYLATDGTCTALLVPRQIAPLSTATVTTRRPTLRWQLPPDATSVVVELCVDRACTTPLAPPATVTGTRYAPTFDLPRGVVYWRLRTAPGSAVTSPVWELFVGARSAPVDASWGTSFDCNGDGRADVAVGAVGAGVAYVYLGSAGGVPPTPTVILRGTAVHDGFGGSVASAGDVDGDGYADLLVGGGGRETDRASIYLGGPTGVGVTPALTLLAPDDAGADFGGSAVGAGDVDGDGYADVLIGAQNADVGGVDTGRAYLYRGGPTGLTPTPAVALAPDVASAGGRFGSFGNVVGSAGDVNGDGYADVVVGDDEANDTHGRAFLYLGSATGLPRLPTTTLAGPGPRGVEFGYPIAGAGDVNGDGYADVVAGAGGGFAGDPGAAFVYLGGPVGLTPMPATTLVGAGGNFGDWVAAAGDVDGDGYGDLAVGASTLGDQGTAYVFLGGPSGLSTGAAVMLTPPADEPHQQFADHIAGAGDIDRDGHDDLLIGAPGDADARDGYVGAAYVYRGALAGVDSAPAFTLTYVDSGFRAFFGASVAL